MGFFFFFFGLEIEIRIKIALTIVKTDTQSLGHFNVTWTGFPSWSWQQDLSPNSGRKICWIHWLIFKHGNN